MKEIEYSNNNSLDHLNKHQKASTLPVDHCKLRPLSDISSDPYCPAPILTTKASCPIPVTCRAFPNTSKTVCSSILDKENICKVYKYDLPNKIHELLSEYGFYIFKNMISNDKIDIAKKYIIDDRVNIFRLTKEYIKPHIINDLGKHIDRNIINMKSRVSNKNNSSDTAFFHRDIHNYSNYKNTRIYTILNYIDGGNMEIIPRSNNKKSMTVVDAINMFSKKKSIILEPGDVLMIDSTLIHKGIFYKKQRDSRIIQLFDCVFDYDYDYYLRTILHVSCRNDCSKTISSVLIKLNNNKNKNLSNILNYIVYLNTALGYSQFGNTPFSQEKYKYISIETNQSRLENPYNDIFVKNNKYMINIEGIQDIKNENRIIFMFVSFTLNFLIMLILVIFAIFILFLLLNLAICH